MRYERQILLPEVGEKGQRKLRNSKVLLVGVGGLGSPISLYLTGAGIGQLGLMDDDVVSLTNLHRQILYTEKDLGKKKVICAKEHLEVMNSDVDIKAYPLRLTTKNAQDIISEYDIVVDGSDNYSTRYLINDVCLELNKTYVYGAICGFEGQVSVFNYRGGISYRDLYPDENGMKEATPVFKGVVGTTPAVVGSVEANEVIKVVCEIEDVLAGRLWTIDLRTMHTHVISF